MQWNCPVLNKVIWQFYSTSSIGINVPLMAEFPFGQKNSPKIVDFTWRNNLFKSFTEEAPPSKEKKNLQNKCLWRKNLMSFYKRWRKKKTRGMCKDDWVIQLITIWSKLKDTSSTWPKQGLKKFCLNSLFHSIFIDFRIYIKFVQNIVGWIALFDQVHWFVYLIALLRGWIGV